MWSKGLARASGRARSLRMQQSRCSYAKWACPDEDKQLKPNEYIEAGKTKPFLDAAKTPMSDEMRQKLNSEFELLTRDLAFGSDLTGEIAERFVAYTKQGEKVFNDLGRVAENQSPPGSRPSFPNLGTTSEGTPYSSAELHARRAFHAHMAAGMGAEISEDVYRPHEDVHKPAERASIAALIAAGAHLGHAKASLRANCLPFIYGLREGIHIIDLEQTLSALRRASRVVEGVAERAGTILFVGGRDGQKQIVETAADRGHAYYVHGRWIAGTITNGSCITEGRKRVELDMADQPTNRDLSSSYEDTTNKPDLCIILNPVENRPLLQECLATRVPTIGIVDTDSEPSLLTYPIPGNDDSLRFCSLVAGILSNAAKRGRTTRINEFHAYEAAREKAKRGEGFNRPAEEATGKFATLSEEEIAMAQAA